MQVRTTLLDITELEHLDLKTEQREGNRYYIDENGEAFPSVTTVVGLESRKQIQLWRERVGEEEANKISSAGAKRGTLFHQHVEDYLKKDKEFIEFENIIQEGMFRAVRPVLDEIVPLAIEAPMYSNTLKMAGRVDCIGMFEGQLMIIDFKSSAKPKEEYMAKQWYLQMAAYALMVEELTGHEIEECMALVAVEGMNSFQMFNCDHRDYIEPLALLRKQYRNLYGI
jgi:genome maintenance exonuclease 1